MKINTTPLTEEEKAQRIINVKVVIQPEKIREMRVELMTNVWFKLRSHGFDIQQCYHAVRECKNYHPLHNAYELAR